MFYRWPATAVVLFLCSVASAAAQTNPPPLPSRPIELTSAVRLDESPTDRLFAVQQWTTDYEEWKVWFGQWRNRREPGWVSTRDRKERPAPPAWLPAACAQLLDDAGPMTRGCQLLREWRRDDYAADVLTEQVASTRADLEAPRKSAWWRHVHLDALWPMTQAGSNGFGVCGVHATLDVTRRVQVFLAPGAILMRVPSPDGASRWTPATDWGFSYRLFDFRLPAVQRPGTLHLNIARVWIFGADALPVSRELYLAGFSLTLNPR